jgi:FtsH-binding integral membrane protein
MTSAALSPTAASATSDAGLNLYLRAVWARLGAGALAAAFSAWLVAALTPLRAAIVLEQSGHIVGLSLFGVTLAGLPFIIWAGTRAFARSSLPSAPSFWLFAVAAGAGANALALLFLQASVVSIFVIAAAGFGALHMAHWLVRQTPTWLTALVFIAVGLTAEWIINAVLAGSWPFIALDLAAIGFLALLIVLRAGDFARIHQDMSHSNVKEGAAFAAMHLITLAQARSDQHISINEEELP